MITNSLLPTIIISKYIDFVHFLVAFHFNHLLTVVYILYTTHYVGILKIRDTINSSVDELPILLGRLKI